MNCPNCNTKLHMTERKGIEIDYCPDCRGIWLDRGELDKIVEKTLADEQEHHQIRTPQQGVQVSPNGFPEIHHREQYDSHNHKYGHKKHRKPWFMDLFD
ncbi:TFIIB-type zinc ribbon-containing protein [Halodesulfovibrio marinisediminis]|uniref:Transcription factor zinc-finger domain-containing protein n=1 Tax=Halodesulfovibrio marinisediminis DSM 17456 TaxID=1121457 RepID=A0A1N6DMP0_9BACT|nr:zf-TFIIB domain-containing protein [Halodesulfovibrio marinisediminis]SIN72079.1 hypothetical protein SAMN02745161_0323 [Halodesulfovibrio marinisediminis DSM 17456]